MGIGAKASPAAIHQTRRAAGLSKIARLSGFLSTPPSRPKPFRRGGRTRRHHNLHEHCGQSKANSSEWTAEALLRYRMDQRDMNIKQPLNRIGPMLNRLAQGQALAVLEGTAVPYKLATLAEPGEIKGPAAELLSATRKVALKEMMKDFISDWGIALDVEIKPASENLPPRSKASWAYDSRPLVAHFRPRNLSVRLPRGLSAIPSNEQFRARPRRSTRSSRPISRRAA